MTTSGWVAVRCIFRTHFGEQQVYEERVTLWHEADMDRAIELAEAEAHRYVQRSGAPEDGVLEFVGLAQAYQLDDEPGHGAEVFSMMRASALEPEAYLDAFFDTGSERVADREGA